MVDISPGKLPWSGLVSEKKKSFMGNDARATYSWHSQTERTLEKRHLVKILTHYKM